MLKVEISLNKLYNVDELREVIRSLADSDLLTTLIKTAPHSNMHLNSSDGTYVGDAFIDQPISFRTS